MYLGSSLGVKSLKFLDASVPNTSKTFLFMRANLKRDIRERTDYSFTFEKRDLFQTILVFKSLFYV